MAADRNVVGERSETSVSPALVVTAIIINTRLQLLRCRYINPRGTGIFDRGSPIRIIVRPSADSFKSTATQHGSDATDVRRAERVFSLLLLLLLLYPRRCSSAPGACIVFLETNIIIYTECLSASFI